MLIDLTDVVFMVEGGRIGKLRVSWWHRVEILCIGGSLSEIEEETQFYTLYVMDFLFSLPQFDKIKH